MFSVKLPSPRNESIHSRVSPRTYVTPEQIDRIFEQFTIGNPAYLPLLFGYKCGMRLGETYAITWDCIDFNQKTLTINKQVQWDEKAQHWYFSNPKYNSFRTIEIDSDFCKILIKEKNKQDNAKVFYAEHYTSYYEGVNRHITTSISKSPINFVNVRENGTYIQARTMHHASRIIHRQIGLSNFTFHSLRHTHATMLGENDAPIKYAQSRLGHKNIQITLETYQHLTKNISTKGTKILDEMYKTDKD